MVSMTARSNYIESMKIQLTELITNYHPAVLWFDGDWCQDMATPNTNQWWIKTDATNLYNYVTGLKPDMIVNERVKRELGLGDFECPEQTVPPAPLSRFWETSATMNGVWGFNTNDENPYRSPSNILNELVRVVSRDGNYLLNIGPKRDGSMTAGSISILNALASWMSVCSESIHGTTRSPFVSEPSWGYYTKKPGKLYAHVFNWPTDGQATLSWPTWVAGNAITGYALYSTTNLAVPVHWQRVSYPAQTNGAAFNVAVPVEAGERFFKLAPP
jgi:alpha-L-fucosidase